MESLLRLFKAVEVKTNGTKKCSKAILNETLKNGFIFSPQVVYNYSEKELLNLISEVKLGLFPEQLNNSFHKSWKKIKKASIEQLVIEQLTHYFTTYGFENLGIYNKDSVYIPNEKLEIPKLKEGINLTIIKGYTKKEIKEKLLFLLQSGIALSEDSLHDIIDISTSIIELGKEEIEVIKNKEVKMAFYDFMDILPENPIEFLRYMIYKSTEKTLLIKDARTIEQIKSRKNFDILNLFIKYKENYELTNLAQIFYRFKPIFLAFRTNKQMNVIVNRIRRLAKKYHEPMQGNYLNEITAKIKKGEEIEKNKLEEELSKVNIFRKVRLAYALKFRTKNVFSILYKIRNGKGYATDFFFSEKREAKRILDIVMDSIVENMKTNLKEKKIYIPENIVYTLPATEKQFTGYFPSGTYITIPKDMIVGIHWENVDGNRIDLDLSLINAEDKLGWDSSYRSGDGKILFSGDMTDASKPKGASELYHVKRQSMDAYTIFVNYYNYNEKIEVPFKIIVAKEQISNFSENYMVDPNNVSTIVETKINQRQKILGLLIITTEECRFYFAETYLGKNITSSKSIFVENSRRYLFDFYRNTISLNEILEKAGIEMVESKDECDIDLSPENLEKDTIISLMYAKNKINE